MDPNNQYQGYGTVEQAGLTSTVGIDPNNFKRQRLIVVGMIFFVIIGVISVFMIISSKKDPALAGLEKVIGINKEISRVSDLALADRTLSGSARHSTATARILANSSSLSIQNLISDELSENPSQSVIDSFTNSSNDEAIQRATQIGTTDEAIAGILKELLIEANFEIGNITTDNQTILSQLQDHATSNEIVFNSL